MFDRNLNRKEKTVERTTVPTGSWEYLPGVGPRRKPVLRAAEFERRPIELDDPDQARLVGEMFRALNRFGAPTMDWARRVGVDTVGGMLDLYVAVQEMELAGVVPRDDLGLYVETQGHAVAGPITPQEVAHRWILTGGYPQHIPPQERPAWVAVAVDLVTAHADPGNPGPALPLPWLDRPAVADQCLSALDHAEHTGHTPATYHKAALALIAAREPRNQ